MTLSTVEPAGTEGASRINGATGANEIYRSGYWLPAVNFGVSRESCQAYTDQILKSTTINFVTGSGRLGPRAVSVMNRLAATLHHCFNDATLSLEIGGHTDSQGEDASNLALSNDRAVAVVEALAARGAAAKPWQP